MKVLIVEDEFLIGLTLSDIAEQAGHEVMGICSSLEEAKALTRSDGPDVALVDLRLGDKRCGATVAHYLDEAFHTLSVFVTGNADTSRKYRAVAIGFVEKPFAASDISQVLAYLDSRRRDDPPGRPPYCLTLFGEMGDASRGSGPAPAPY